MNETVAKKPGQTRRPRVLWANLACLLDTSSGASMSVREMLIQLSKSMVDVRILGATHFDSDRGTDVIKSYPHAHHAKPGEMLVIRDGNLVHNLFVTANVLRSQMTSREESAWLAKYAQMLASFRPDLVFFYGGYPLEHLIADEARVRGIPTAAYVANANYNGTRWCRDVDLILTDSEATAGMYAERFGLPLNPVGKFINQDKFISPTHTRRNVLFVNPAIEKGGAIVMRLAAMLNRSRPDIPIEVVESRGKWSDILAKVKPVLGDEVTKLSNVTVTPHVSDMRPVYGRARILLAPSLWWESAARVIAEALLNAVPCIATNRGGSAEMIGDGGVIVSLPDRYFEKPYAKIPEEAELLPFMTAIIEMYDNEASYQALVANARRVGEERHHISISTRRLMAQLAPLLDLRAGDGDLESLALQQHRHGKRLLKDPKLAL